MKVELGPIKSHMKVLSLKPVEACGILLGETRDGVVRVYALYHTENLKMSPVEFESDPWQVVQAYRVSEKLGISVVGVFHTHTHCPPKPSASDSQGMDTWPYPWVIACPREVRAWIKTGSKVVEELEVV